MPFALIDPRSPWRPLPPLRLASVARSLDIEDIAAVVRRSGIGQERWYGRVERKLQLWPGLEKRSRIETHLDFFRFWDRNVK